VCGSNVCIQVSKLNPDFFLRPVSSKTQCYASYATNALSLSLPDPENLENSSCCF
jgi:hypothetical protein